MGQTMVEKIMQKHSDEDAEPGKIIWIDIDIRSARDFGGANVVKNMNTYYPGQKVHDRSKTYFTFDSDGLCASNMYGTTNPELFGITPWQARDIILGCRGLDIIGVDYMEHNPTKDASGYSTLVSTMMCFELLRLLADSREASTGRRTPTTWE